MIVLMMKPDQIGRNGSVLVSVSCQHHSQVAVVVFPSRTTNPTYRVDNVGQPDS
jgi:hypothetical protein